VALRRSFGALLASAALYGGDANAQGTGAATPAAPPGAASNVSSSTANGGSPRAGAGISYQGGAPDPAATALINAVRKSDRGALRQLLQKKTDVNAASADGSTALTWAAQLGDLETAQLLLAAGANARTANRYGITPLQAAAVNGDPALIKALLKAGADPNAVLPEGETILMTAARTGRVAALEALLDGGARLEGHEKWFGETPLIWAAAENHGAAVELLIRRGADANAASAKQNYRSRRSGQSVMALGSWTPLMYAARENALDAGRALIAGKANPDLVDPDGATALVIAILNANYDFAKLLLDAGADPNIVDTAAGMGPLYAAIDMHRLAVGHGRPNPHPSGALDALDIVRLLLERKADPNARLKAVIMQRQHTAGDSTLAAGATPLMRAAKSGDIAMVRVLLAGGADPTATLPNKTTPLMFAAGLGWRDGSPAAPSYDQGPPEEAVETIKALMAAGIDINASNDAGDTALHAAVSGRGSEVIVRALLALGADTTAKNKRGQTPLDAVMASRKDSVKPLADLLRVSAKP
jgi:ankyrin repeat protein